MIQRFDGDIELKRANDFVAISQSSRNQPGRLWISDGTQAGTLLLGEDLDFLGTSTNRIIAHDDRTLYRINGNDGSLAPYFDIKVANSGSDPFNFHLTQDGLAYFTKHDRNIRVVDGDESRIVRSYSSDDLVNVVIPDPDMVGNQMGLDSVRDLLQSDGVTWLLRNKGLPLRKRSLELWRFSDGNALELVASIPTTKRAEPSNLVELDNHVFFGDGEGGLWRVHMTSGTSQRIARYPEVDCCENADIRSITPLGRYIFFTVDDGIHGTELWMSDASSEGTRLAADIRPGKNPSFPQNLFAYGDAIYFSANDGMHGRELWRVAVDGAMADGVLGDINSDGQLDAGDVEVLRTHFLKRTDQGIAHGDLNLDGLVSFADFLILNAHFTSALSVDPTT